MDVEKYFMINLHESMGPSLDRTHGPWVRMQSQGREVLVNRLVKLAQEKVRLG